MTLNGNDDFNNLVVSIKNINIYDTDTTNTEENSDYKINIPLSNSFNNLLIFSDEFNKINELSNILDDLFLKNNKFVKTNISTNYKEINYDDSQIIFNHKYEQEFERGNIEYKRTLETYKENDKINKLIRQINWRIYEGVVCIDNECCYYIIGIEDSGHPSFLTKNELLNSLYFISKCVDNSEITYSYLFVKNTILNYEYVIVKFLPNESDFFDYF
jgi:hypothetical protein